MKRLSVVAVLLAATINAQNEPPKKRGEFFGLDKMWEVHLVVQDAGWEGMYPRQRRFGLGQTKYPYAKATLQLAGHPKMTVGLRFKGASTFWTTGRQLKRSFKIDFNRFEKDQSFLGLKKLSLNNNALDPTQIQEAVAYTAYRDGGAPASRTAFARVYLTVVDHPDEKIENEYLGLYTIIEQVDRSLLKRQLGKKGALMKPGRQVLNYYGETWNDRYKNGYEPRTPITPEQGQIVAELASISNDYRRGWFRGEETDDEEAKKRNQEDFQKRLGKVMDVDQFLRYSAVTFVICNRDSPFYIPHNYYLAVLEKKNKIVWLPWDLNMALGGLNMSRARGMTETSIYKPTTMPLFVRMMEIPAYKKRYTEIVDGLIKNNCSAKTLTANVEVARKTTAAAKAAEAKRNPIVMNYEEPGRSGFNFGRGLSRRRGGSGDRDFASFFQAREKSVLDQLAGRSEGIPVSSRRSRFGNRGNRGQGGNQGEGGNRGGLDLGNLLGGGASRTLKGILVAGGAMKGDKPLNAEVVGAAAEKCFKDYDTDNSNQLDGIELRAATHKYLELRDGKQEVDMSGTISRHFRRGADKDGDLKVSLVEWTNGVKGAFRRWDRDRNGVLSKEELSLRPAR